VLVCSFLATAAFGQQTTREMRESANAKLAQGAYAEAIGDLEGLIAVLGESTRDDIKSGLEHVYFSLGICHFFTADFASAEKAFQTYLKLYPHGGKVMEAWVFIGDAQRFGERTREAIQTYETALKRFSYGLDLRADIYVGIARCHLAEDNWEGAIPALQMTYRTAPDPLRRSWAATLMATAFLKTVDLPKLYPLIPTLLTKGSFAERSIAFNLSALEAGDELFAEERYREALWIHRLVYPHDVVVARSGEYLDLLQRRAEFERRRPGNPRTLMRLQENIGELEAEIEAIQGIDNYDLELQYRIARGYMEQRRYREACELFLNLHTVADREVAEESLYLAFQCATYFLPWDKAYEIGGRYMEKYPDGEWYDALSLMMGQMYAKEENWPTVITHLATALSVRPSHSLEADCRFLLGYACFMEERFTEAIEHFMKLRTKFPQHELMAAAVYWTAMTHLFDGDYNAAAPDFDEVLDRHPDSIYVEDSAFRRAVCAYGLTHYEDADGRLAAFIAAYPQSKLTGEATMMRGDVAGVFGDGDAAIRFYTQAMEGENLNMEFYNHCAFQSGTILTDAERFDEARTFFQRYVETNREGSNIPLATFWIGKCILKLQGESAALKYYQDSMAKFGKDRAEIGVDMILDEWIGLTRKVDAEKSRIAWSQLQQGLREANRNDDRTTALRLQRMLMFHPSLVEADRERVMEQILKPENFEHASPAVLQFILDTARERGMHDLAKAAASRIIEDFTETDYALDARMTLAEYAIEAAREAGSGSTRAPELYAEAIRHLGVIREVYASSGEAGKALLILGELFREQRKFKEADEAYKDILGVREWRPIWAEALYGRGLCHMQDRKYVEASAFFERIYLMYAGYQKWSAKAYLRRAECLERIYDKPKAIETLRDMLARPEYEGLPEADEARQLIIKYGGQP